MRKSVPFALALAIALAIVALGAVVFGDRPAADNDSPDAAGDVHVIAGGFLQFVRPDDFGLAATEEQLLVSSYIPPCDFGFDYCLYYHAPTFEGTTFESAGLRIQRRSDLSTQSACLAAPPAGYVEFEPQIRQGDRYATAKFAPVGDAAMGHYASGELYRLFFDAGCYEFETRIGQSQFANYEPGAIEEFTKEHAEALEARLRHALSLVRFVERPSEVIFSPDYASSKNLN